MVSQRSCVIKRPKERGEVRIEGGRKRILGKGTFYAKYQGEKRTSKNRNIKLNSMVV
jgi:hypothetical protein